MLEWIMGDAPLEPVDVLSFFGVCSVGAVLWVCCLVCYNYGIGGMAWDRLLAAVGEVGPTSGTRRPDPVLLLPFHQGDGKPAPSESRSVLLVIAHPDDEVMFFMPLLTSFAATPSVTKVHILCLSTGDAGGKGTIRRKELSRSVQVFANLRGWSASDNSWIELEIDGQFEDGMNVSWEPSAVASAIKAYGDRIQAHEGGNAQSSSKSRCPFDFIATFDDYGVSGHPNHISCYNGVRKYLSTFNAAKMESTADESLSPSLISNPILLTVRSLPLVVKYTGGMLLLPRFASRLSLIGHARPVRAPIIASAVDPMDEPTETYRLVAFTNLDSTAIGAPANVLLMLRGYWTMLSTMWCHWTQLVWFRWLYVAFATYTHFNDVDVYRVAAP